MTSLYWRGSAPRVLLIAGLTALAPRAAAGGQNAAPTPSLRLIAPSFGAVLAADADENEAANQTSGQRPDAGRPQARARGRGVGPKFNWRNASLEFGRNKARIDFRTRMRAENRESDAAISRDALGGLDIPRRRIGVDGQVLQAFAFKVDRELDSKNAAGTPTPPWRDVYVDVTQLAEAQFRYGQFKMPFSLDETTGSLDLDFAYRSSTASLLAPGRAKGWMVHGDTLGHAVGYEYGIFKSDGSNALVRTSEKRVNTIGETSAWRVTIEPLRGLHPLLNDMHVGYAKTEGDLPEGISGIQGRTVLGADFYRPDFYVLGLRQRKGLEFQWRPGPASIKWESITLTEERKGQSVEDTDLSPFQVKGWYVSGSYAFTGETKARGLTRPNRPLFQGGIGALEAAVRVERLTFGSILTGVGSESPRADVLPSNTDRIVAFSGNWYPNRWLKIQMTITKEEFTDPSTLARELRPTPSFWSRVLRIQFSL